MSSPPDLPFEVLRAPNGDRIFIVRPEALLATRLTPEQCRRACALLCDEESEPTPVG